MPEVKVVGSPEKVKTSEELEESIQVPEKSEVDPREPKFEETPEIPENIEPEVKPEVEPVPEELKKEDVPKEVVEEVPEQYRGKTDQELIEMHQNLEKVMGKQGQKIGEYKSILQPYANFDNDGNIVSWKERETEPQKQERTQEEWNALEEKGVTKEAYETLYKEIETRFDKKLELATKPFKERALETDFNKAKSLVYNNPEQYPKAKEWATEIEQLLEREDPKYRHLFVEDSYWIVAGRKSVQAQAKAKTVSAPKEKNKKPYAETPTPVRSEVKEEYDSIAAARADGDERFALRGMGK